jgi:hypothetical protein
VGPPLPGVELIGQSAVVVNNMYFTFGIVSPEAGVDMAALIGVDTTSGKLKLVVNTSTVATPPPPTHTHTHSFSHECLVSKQLVCVCVCVCVYVCVRACARARVCVRACVRARVWYECATIPSAPPAMI